MMSAHHCTMLTAFSMASACANSASTRSGDDVALFLPHPAQHRYQQGSLARRGRPMCLPFVDRHLRHAARRYADTGGRSLQLPPKRPREDGLIHLLRPPPRDVHRRLNGVRLREQRFDLGNDAALFGEWGKRDI